MARVWTLSRLLDLQQHIGILLKLTERNMERKAYSTNHEKYRQALQDSSMGGAAFVEYMLEKAAATSVVSSCRPILLESYRGRQLALALAST